MADTHIIVNISVTQPAPQPLLDRVLDLAIDLSKLGALVYLEGVEVTAKDVEGA